MKQSFKTVSIDTLKENVELKEFYQQQSIDELTASIKAHGQKSPIHITESGVILDGYRRVAAIQNLGSTEAYAVVHPDEPSVYLRMLFNQYRKKTPGDEVSEVKAYYKLYPKKQGCKTKNGEPYNREKNIEVAVGYRWKGDLIKMVETIIEKDFEDNFLMKQIVQNKFNVEPTFEYISKWKDIDITNNYGYTDKLLKGEISITDINKFIKDRHFFENKYQDTFVIPEKAKSYHIDCIELGNIDSLIKTVDTIFTSIPYYLLRNYENGDLNQIGHEESKYEFCERIANYFLSLIPLLKDSSNVMINVGETYDDGIGLGIPELLKETIERITGLIYKDKIVWSKANPKPQNENVKRPINNVEYILWFVVNPKKAKYNLLTYSDGTEKVEISNGAKDVDKDGKVWDNNKSLSKPYKKIYTHLQEQQIREIIFAKTGKNHDVYKICQEAHPAIMSPVLPVVPILMTTDEGDVVLDPFSGTNVVGRMTCLLNRKALSGELSKKYFNIGCEMLEQSVADFDNVSFSKIKEIFQPTRVFEKHEFNDGSIIFNEDNIDVLKTLPDNSIDSIVTDPPYGLSMLNKEWDVTIPQKNVWDECMRVLKPGGHLLSFGSPRTYHKMTSNIEASGFEIRDQLMWVFGQGFPKSHDIGNGQGTSLKPAHEPIVLARKPLSEGTVSANVLKWGTGAINIEDCRIDDHAIISKNEDNNLINADSIIVNETSHGRFPANLFLDEYAANLLDNQSGLVNTGHWPITKTSGYGSYGGGKNNYISAGTKDNIKSGASKFFYCPKASKKDKDLDIVNNTHPTVKPTLLMQYLIRLITPKNGVCLDIYFGSGTTGKASIMEGFKFIGIEKEKEYYDISVQRCEHHLSSKQDSSIKIAA
ncbi:MAG: ParB N-terminal domain-containing protein [Sphingobacteriia bacterium]|nr:ParB N-terminal domain-containing protein [Sphingobacteriia bacterium]